MPTPISIIIPVYNERDNLEKALDDVLAGVASEGIGAEIVFVDDGSTDGSPEVLNRLARSHPAIRVLKHDRNRGKGAALVTGFEAARLDWILFLDADNQIRMSELTRFVPHMAQFDLIVGRRLNREESILRRVLSKGYGCLVATTLGCRVKDINCPFKLFRRSILAEMTLHARGFLIDAELVGKAMRRGCRVKEIGVQALPRTGGTSSVRPRHVHETLMELWKVWRRG